MRGRRVQAPTPIQAIKMMTAVWGGTVMEEEEERSLGITRWMGPDAQRQRGGQSGYGRNYG